MIHSKRTTHHNPSPARRYGMPVAALLSAMLLTACGGGGGNPGTTSSGGGTTGTGGTTTPGAVAATPTVGVVLADANGKATNALSSATPLTVQATVLGADKKPVPNAIVTFATDNSLAVFSPASGTSLTDANGVATISMRSATLAAGGAGTVTATSTVAGTTVQGTSNYAVGTTTVSFGTLTAQPANIQAYGSTLLSVDILAGGAKYTDQQVNVTFSSACVTAGKASLSTVAASNGGTAQTVYRDKGCGGADVVTASAAGVGKPVSATVQVAPPTAASLQFVSAEPLNQSIVIKGQGGNGRTETATLTFKLVDTSGNPIIGREVDFTTSTNTVHLNAQSGITDTDGKVIATVNSGDVATTFRVQASLPTSATTGGQTISTQSDSVVVTTGLPVQRAFSIGPVVFNVDGSINKAAATTVSVMLADANSNPVPDGTPVVFQTNLGSIGTSDKGGCNTVNGGCSVPFNTQNPRKATPGQPATPCNTGAGSLPDSVRPGIATICSSTTDGINTLSARTHVVFSVSNTPGFIYLGGTPIDLSTLSSPINLGTASSSTAKKVMFELDDANLNPMPYGTALSISDTSNVTAPAPSPATVQNVLPDTTSLAHQGTMHTLSLSSGNSDPATCKTTDASFTLNIAMPGGQVYAIPFKLTFTCP